MTWLRSNLSAGRLLADLASTALATFVLRPTARLLRLVDDAHDTDPEGDEEP